ncbi:hypothetical protein DH2020_038458 [Rehmannia glutinosa]|uniref:Uncharacterized protein n=1 Tax=Rehmannia glutinosa TaxID=99300 RepID=A0ABR0UYC8_REHGL
MATKKSQEDQRAKGEIVTDLTIATTTPKAPDGARVPEGACSPLRTSRSTVPEVTACVEKGKMKKMSGVKSKQLLLWVPIVEMSIEEPGGEKIYFKTQWGLGGLFPSLVSWMMRRRRSIWRRLLSNIWG